MSELDDRQVLHDATRRLDRHLQEIARLELLRDGEIQRIQAWFDDVSHGERAEAERLAREVEQWALAHRDDRHKSWSTPWAKITTKQAPGKTVIDDEDALLAWCEENGYGRVTIKPDLSAIRATFKVAEDGRIVAGWTTDEFGDPAPASFIPGVHVEGHGGIGVTVKPFVARTEGTDDGD